MDPRVTELSILLGFNAAGLRGQWVVECFADFIYIRVSETEISEFLWKKHEK